MKKCLVMMWITVVLLGGCIETEGPAGAPGLSSLVDMANEPMGDSCPGGGVKINSGLDINGNGILEDTEIQDTKYVCNGEAGGPQDKEIRIEINANNMVVGNMAYQVIGGLVGFDKRRFADIDSIILVGNPHIAPLSKDIVYMDLYNVTDDVPIANSELLSTNTPDNFTFAHSQNIYESLPEKEIDIALRMRSQLGSDFLFATARSTALILYRVD